MMGSRFRNSFQVKHPSSSSYETAQCKTGHDEAGQVFTETIRAGRSMTAEWKWRTKGSTRIHGRFRSEGPGCSTLIDMAVRSCLMYSYDITSEVLEEVPEYIGRVLWSHIVAA